MNKVKMKRMLLFVGLAITVLSCSNNNDIPKIKSLLIKQLKNIHENQDWFVPINSAVEGLSVEQSNWKDSTSNHSIRELVSHLTFWNEMNLKAFKGEKISDFDGDNKTTFRKHNNEDWDTLITKLDKVQSEWENLIEKATNEKINEWSIDIANMSSHNAYHTGQIIYIRKQNGWWNLLKNDIKQ